MDLTTTLDGRDRDVRKSQRAASPSAREIVASIIALALTAMTIWDLLIMLGVLGSSDASFTRAKEVFLSLSGTCGTILGFYFGSMSTQAAQSEALRASLRAERQGRLVRDGVQRALLAGDAGATTARLLELQQRLGQGEAEG